MKKYRLLSVLLFLCCTLASAQKIQYSKSVFRTPGAGTLQLLANINGFHHLIYFSNIKKPVVYIFNNQLQLQSTKELNIRITENCDIRLLKLKDYYVLYAHTLKPSRHQLLKINRDGVSSDISALLNKPADSLWNRSTATYQLFNNEDSMFLVSHTYLHPVKKIRTTVVKLNPESGAAISAQVLFPFNASYDELKEVTLQKKQLLILKNSKDEDLKNTLTVMKADLLRGTQLSKQFESGKYVYYNPALRYNISDSTIFIYSMLTTPAGYRGVRPGLFMVRLSSTLNELSPVQTIPNIFRYNAITTFIVEKANTYGWMSFSYSQKNFGTSTSTLMPTRVTRPPEFYPIEASIENYYYYNNDYGTAPTAVLMILLNNRLEKAKDSVVKNNGNYYKIHPSPHAQFILKNTACLLVVEELAAKKKGLLLVSPGDKGNFNTLPIRVYDRFDFMLTLLQTDDDNSFIVPFTNKKEIGLMKVTLSN